MYYLLLNQDGYLGDGEPQLTKGFSTLKELHYEMISAREWGLEEDSIILKVDYNGPRVGTIRHMFKNEIAWPVNNYNE
jgi:hypothetical protein